MFPTTISESEFTSPLAQTLSQQTLKPLTDLQSYKDEVALADLTGGGLLEIRGDEAEKALQGIYENVPTLIGTVARVADGLLARLRDDQFMLIFRGDDFAMSAGKISEAAAKSESLITLTDLTHGRGHLLLIGKSAAKVLPKICGLNFSEAAFPDGSAAQTSLAKVRTLIIRADVEAVPTFHLIVGSSLLDYTWKVIADAIQEFNGALIIFAPELLP